MAVTSRPSVGPAYHDRHELAPARPVARPDRGAAMADAICDRLLHNVHRGGEGHDETDQRECEHHPVLRAKEHFIPGTSSRPSQCQPDKEGELSPEGSAVKQGD